MDTDETERLAQGISPFLPARVPWMFRVNAGLSGDEAIFRVLSLVRLFAQQSPSQWPCEEEWESLLPEWVLRAVPALSRAQVEKLLATTPRDKWDSLPWERSSWFEALRDRGWRWWGVNKVGDHHEMALSIVDLPERIDCFRELLRICAIEILEEDYFALNSH